MRLKGSYAPQIKKQMCKFCKIYTNDITPVHELHIEIQFYPGLF